MSNTIDLSGKTWLTVTPEAGGPGEDIVKAIATKTHYGRQQLTAVIRWEGDFVDPVERTVLYKGKERYAEFDKNSYASTKYGQKIEISGYSNSENLHFSLSGDSPNNILSPIYTVNNVEVGDGEPIPLDPGKTDRYRFSIILDMPSNLSSEPVSRVLQVFGPPIAISLEGPIYSKALASVTIVTSNNENYLEVEDKSLTLSVLGDIKTLKVNSNTNWKVKIHEI